VTTAYDGYGRLTSYTRTLSPSQANVYNGFDERVTITNGTTTHHFVYDRAGRVLGEYGTSATDVRAETIWLTPDAENDNQPFGGDDGIGGYAPLAIAVQSGTTTQLVWVYGNHLGVPLVTTNASAAPVTLPGFPGQMRTFDDLYYNQYRDYDPTLGRYIQADPIGLSGGANPYVYAENNGNYILDVTD
jgi:RHS repeat-associated protein